MNSKIKIQINKITELKQNIENWQNLTSQELEKLLIDFEKQPRQEMSSYYVGLFRDIHFANILIMIAKSHTQNDKITSSIISALGMMMWRYELPENEDIYQLMITNMKRKGAGIYVAFHLPKMKMFHKYPNKWEYFMNIAKLSPKKTSHEYFTLLVEEHICSAPTIYKAELIKHFTQKYDETKSEYQKERYKKILSNLQA